MIDPLSSSLGAVIFDVDGTLVDSERDGHRVAFNRAFEEFGLPDRWDVDHYGRLLHITGGQRRLQADLKERGMPEHERDHLVPLLHARKTEIFRELIAGGLIETRPGVNRLLDELEHARIRLAVATTGTRAWVHPLLDRLFGTGRFEVVVTGDEAPQRKPDPSVYHLALERLRSGAAETIAIEDSRNGLVAALGAEIRCAVVVNAYTCDQDFEEAELVIDGFGAPERPATVIRDPHGVTPPCWLGATVLARIADR